MVIENSTLHIIKSDDAFSGNRRGFDIGWSTANNVSASETERGECKNLHVKYSSVIVLE